MRRLFAILASVIVIACGWLTLLGLVVGDNLGFLTPIVQAGHIRELTALLLQLVVMTAAVTIVIGVLNLFQVHGGRILRQRRGWPYSLVLLFSAILVWVLTILERNGMVFTPAGERTPSTILLETVQVALEAALASLVLFALVYGAYRLMRRRVTWSGVLFTVVVLMVLIGALPLPGGGFSLMAQFNTWLMNVPVSAGARGILLGIALATVVTGVRVLIGQDRSYRE
jgi:hypothetical protein